MAGTLLSGWRIRLFNTNGAPLFPGRVCFYDSTTSLPKSVFAERELITPLGNGAGVVETDQEGYLPAIWFQGGLYKADVQVKIQEDPETWSSIWTINDLGVPADTTGGAGSGVLAYCANVAEMKAITAGTVNAAICAGYYDAGDAGTPLFFVWNPDSTKGDDAGAYIRSNDTAVRTPGRYHQVFPTGVLDIRKWGGIPGDTETDCLASLVHMADYASDNTVFPMGPPTIGFVSPGFYHFSGSISFDRTWTDSTTTVTRKIPYYIGNNVTMLSTVGTKSAAIIITISNPTTIESDCILTEYPNTVRFDQGSVEFVRPQWFPNYLGNMASKISHACTFGVPVKVYGQYTKGEITIDSVINWEKSPVYLMEPDIVFTGGSGASLYITSKVFVEYPHKVFDCDAMISDQEIDARWFGWGTDASTDQGPALQRALNASNGQATVYVPRLTNSSHNVNSAVTGLTHSVTHTLRIENFITFGASGSLSGVYLDVSFDQQCLVVPSYANSIILMNPTISPYWFGGKEGTFNASSTTQALLKSFYAGARGRNVVEGGGAVFTINQAVVVDASSVTNALISIKNMTINPSIYWDSTSYPIMLGFHGGVDLEMESVNVNAVNYQGMRSVYFNTYWARVRNCYFSNDVEFGPSSEDYAFVNNQLYGTLAGPDNYGTVFAGAKMGAVISGNTFSGTKVVLAGDTGAETGYTYPMLRNINFTNNFVNSLDQNTPYLGCLYIMARAANTLINGLVITGNTFGGNIPGWANNGEDPDEYVRYRITDSLPIGCSWVAANQSASDVRHLMIIKDNTYDWFDPARDDPAPGYPYNRAGHRQQYLPSTSGEYTTSVSITTQPTMTNDICRYTTSFSLDNDMIFQLTGDTSSSVNLGTSIKGWRRKSGDNTYDPIAPCIGSVMISANANSTGTLMVDLANTQFSGVGSSQVSARKNWKGSSVYYNMTWNIYERW